MATIDDSQLALLAQVTQVMSSLRAAAIRQSTPLPPESIDVMPGIFTMVVEGSTGGEPGRYVLITPETTPPPE